MSKEDCQKHGGRGKWEGTGARLEGCSLPGCCGSLSGAGRAEGRTCFLPCAAVAALLAKPPLGTCPHRGGVSLGNSAGSLWVCCNVLSCRVRQQEALAPSKGPCPAQDSKGMHLLPMCHVL